MLVEECTVASTTGFRNAGFENGEEGEGAAGCLWFDCFVSFVSSI